LRLESEHASEHVEREIEKKLLRHILLFLHLSFSIHFGEVRLRRLRERERERKKREREREKKRVRKRKRERERDRAEPWAAVSGATFLFLSDKRVEFPLTYSIIIAAAKCPFRAKKAAIYVDMKRINVGWK
jgi:hypothetical protein